MKVENPQSYIAKVLTKKIMQKNVLDKRDLQRLIERELREIYETIYR